MDLLILAIHYYEQNVSKELIQFIKNVITIENVNAFYCDSIEYQIR
jgi:hypothetical protein